MLFSLIYTLINKTADRSTGIFLAHFFALTPKIFIIFAKCFQILNS